MAEASAEMHHVKHNKAEAPRSPRSWVSMSSVWGCILTLNLSLQTASQVIMRFRQDKKPLNRTDPLKSNFIHGTLFMEQILKRSSNPFIDSYTIKLPEVLLPFHLTIFRCLLSMIVSTENDYSYVK